MRRIAAPILLLVFASCRREAGSAPVQSPAPSKATAANAPAAATPAAPVANASSDPLAERYAALQSKLHEWSGDGRVLAEGRKEAMQLLEANRNYAPAYVALARIEYREGYINGSSYDRTKLGRAWKLVLHALKLEPANREAHVVAGEISTYTGDFELAADHLEQARALPGETGEIVLAEMMLEQVQRHPEQVIRIGRANADSITKAKQLAVLHDKMAQSYERLGLADQAGEAYRAALVADPQSAWIHSNYAGHLNGRADMRKLYARPNEPLRS
jgi:tetratricopeptide (TPR) repeat protein